MNGQGLGGGILLAVGALLWGAYFLPVWTKRRQFNAAQKNALRIQRTLRILAETAEVPEEVRVEATARQALAHERMLEATGRSHVAEHEVKLAEAKLAEQEAKREARKALRRARTLKREAFRRSHAMNITRTVTALIALVALLGIVVGITLALIGVTTAVLAISSLTILVTIAMLIAIAPRGARIAEKPVARSRTAQAVHVPLETEVRAPSVQRRSVTPRANPARVASPQQPASAVQVEQAKRLLDIARQQAERDQRAMMDAQRDATRAEPSSATQAVRQRAPQRPGAPANAPQRPVARPQQPAKVNATALQSLGMLDELESGMPDLDAALLRRRTAS